MEYIKKCICVCMLICMFIAFLCMNKSTFVLAEAVQEDINVSETKVITSDMLEELYHNKESICIHGDGYRIILKGEDIVNFNNELLTDIDLQRVDDGTKFIINDSNPLCGDLVVELDEIIGKYVYLYNEVKNVYELLNVKDINTIRVSSPGKYMVTDNKLSVTTGWVAYVLIVIAVILTGGSVAYIIVKKQYWFW